jgi:hypothetical protein
MASAAHVDAIAKMLPNLFAVAAQCLRLVANMRSQFKNLMESGAAYQKMIALQFWNELAQLRYRLQANYLISPEK